MNYTSKQPIILDGSEVGMVEDAVYHRTISGSRHLLRFPRAIAFLVETLDAARDAGASMIQVYDKETKLNYITTNDNFMRHALPVDRGKGRQLALELSLWDIDDGSRTQATKEAKKYRKLVEKTPPMQFTFDIFKKGRRQ